MVKFFKAIKYVYYFNKTSRLASFGKYKEAYAMLRKIDIKNLGGRSRFKVSLMQAVLLYANGNYQLSKEMMEYLYATVGEVKTFNGAEIEYLKVYIAEQYELLKDYLGLEDGLISENFDTSSINLEWVSSSIKNKFPVSCRVD